MTKDWKWKLSFNATTYKNKITSLPAEEMWSGNKKWVKGGSLYDFYLVEWAGVNPEMVILRGIVTIPTEKR